MVVISSETNKGGPVVNKLFSSTFPHVSRAGAGEIFMVDINFTYVNFQINIKALIFNLKYYINETLYISEE